MNVFILSFIYVLSTGKIEANAEPCGFTVEECVELQVKIEKAFKADPRILGYAFGTPQSVELHPKGEPV